MLYAGIAGSLLVGVLLSLLGGGGSILTVPLLVYVLDVEPRTAIAMSLVVVGVTSASGALLHAREGRVQWRTALVFGAGGMGGAFIGGQLNPYLAPDTLLLLFACVMVAAAVAMLRRREAEPPAGGGAALPIPRVLAQGAGVGVLSGLVGAGGGFLIVPALTLAGLSTPAAAATSLVVISLQCAAGLVGHLSHLELPWVLTGEILLAAMAGSFLGGKLAGHVPPATLRKGFALFVLTTAALLLSAQAPAPLRERVHAADPWLVSTLFLAMAIPATAWWRLRVARQQQDAARVLPR
ncbi:sulfite exporter TauE/SafE family protein [Corallococcus macrosporus]|uniref:Probable membrane transporter protein n=1 Tax=Corallococcus macrosporus DSM 14697 TaxID=1189310 RepID=A0A250JM92_9BACT|nr:sulfite exporter TauE/SafE family protein [Corallococcus macrosporus]ATB44617.1 membrane protein [Corallococcus macrosporus DSM 14697]